MKKILFAALLSTTALTFAAGGAMAEGKAAIHSETQTNSDTSASSTNPDNSYAHGTVEKNGANISATSTTGTADGTASGTVNTNTMEAKGQVGTKDGDDEAGMMKSNASMASDNAQVDQDMTSKAGTMKVRAKGATGMLSAEEVREVQTNLKQAGYSVSVDGKYGAGTKTALKEYQKAKNLKVTGKYDAETRSSFTTNSTNDGGKAVDQGGASDAGNQ